MPERRSNVFPFNTTIQNRPLLFVLLGALILVGVIGWLDHWLGWEYSLFVFYALPVSFVAWKINKLCGFLFAILCATAWWVAHVGSHPYQSQLGFVVAVLSRLFYFWVLVVAVSAIKQQREIDHARIDSLERVQKLERDNLWASEQEQQRIGRDLHDSLGPHLAAMGYAAASLAKELNRKNQPEAVQAEDIDKLIKEASSLLRELIQGIFPGEMNGLGFSVALENLAHTSSRLSGLPISFYETGDIQIDDPEVGMHLYRITQEALNNAVKHGEAKQIMIILNRVQDSLRLAIVDDGKGMVTSANSHQGIGLSSMCYRAHALNGELTISSNPNEGTIVTCEIPIHTLLTKVETS